MARACGCWRPSASSSPSGWRPGPTPPRSHAGYYRALAERADRPLRGVGQGEWTERLEAEAGNLATAVRWHLAHDRDPLPHLFRVLCTFWILRDHSGEARSWLGQLLPAADSLGAQARAELMWTAVVIANEVGDDPAALAARDRLAPLLDKINDSCLRAVSRLPTRLHGEPPGSAPLQPRQPGVVRLGMPLVQLGVRVDDLRVLGQPIAEVVDNWWAQLGSNQ
jgi:hypothetical protein